MHLHRRINPLTVLFLARLHGGCVVAPTVTAASSLAPAGPSGWSQRGQLQATCSALSQVLAGAERPEFDPRQEGEPKSRSRRDDDNAALMRFIDTGSTALGEALRAMGVDSVATPRSRRLLKHAEACYAAALRLSPESYEALLGLGVVHLVRYRQAYSEGEAALARSALVRAYHTRQAAFEPLYYLAELELLGGERERARALLQILDEQEVKQGAVYVLLAVLAAADGDPEIAAAYRDKAILRGQPSSLLAFVARVDSRRRKWRGPRAPLPPTAPLELARPHLIVPTEFRLAIMAFGTSSGDAGDMRLAVPAAILEQMGGIAQIAENDGRRARFAVYEGGTLEARGNLSEPTAEDHVDGYLNGTITVRREDQVCFEYRVSNATTHEVFYAATACVVHDRNGVNRDAIKAIAKGIADKFDRQDDGRIENVDGRRIRIDKGKRDGVVRGQVAYVHEIGAGEEQRKKIAQLLALPLLDDRKQLTDKIIVGEIDIVEVHENTSVGRLRNGSFVLRGDRVCFK